ncbi:glycosyltransferase family 2 protein [Desulfonatronum sp. SC1]|uniref:glycosyltransferase family 2 protein n=1 Tax=Desulfonatronum sp. SC1 TaxID=2109626 RepID=UPI000D315250|nr:glycosyltransferase family 2 protein [Desulfonatronum sp. SC1]PTN33808.1 glycosyl transferase [Desulfonatronum sp. SC1]
MKLIIQIPCFNEEASLPVTLAELPRQVPGFDTVEWLIIDDGSTDKTIEVARSLGVDHIVRLPNNRGLAKAFMAGIRACLARGADVIVNTDADNQYHADDIQKLVKPILEGKAEIVIGARPIDSIEHFSWSKKILQNLGSWVVRLASGTTVPDAPSGFRAVSAHAAKELNIFSNYTYTLEMIIQAGQKGIPLAWVPVRTNPDLRPSRLMRSIPQYIFRSLITIIRIFVTYRPFRFFFIIGSFLMILGMLLGLRFAYFFFVVGKGVGMIQSLILASILIIMGFQTITLALVADLMSVNRRLLERIDKKLPSRD